MGLKKRNRVSAEFSMSSLTDIIFLLLIFFMLTANFVRVDPFELPKSDSKTVAPTNIAVSLQRDGTLKMNGQKMPLRGLRSAISRELKKGKEENKISATVTIVAEVGVPFDRVVDVMEVAKSLRMKAIIATQPKS